MIQLKASGINKDSQKVQKEFKKSEIEKKEFLEKYGVLRREYHQTIFYKETLNA